MGCGNKCCVLFLSKSICQRVVFSCWLFFEVIKDDVFQTVQLLKVVFFLFWCLREWVAQGFRFFRQFSIDVWYGWKVSLELLSYGNLGYNLVCFDRIVILYIRRVEGYMGSVFLGFVECIFGILFYICIGRLRGFAFSRFFKVLLFFFLICFRIFYVLKVIDLGG